MNYEKNITFVVHPELTILNMIIEISFLLQVPDLLWILWASHDWSNLSDAFQHVLYIMDSGKLEEITTKSISNHNIFASSLLACLTMMPRLTSSPPVPASIMWAPREHFTGTGAFGSTFSRLYMYPLWCSSLLSVCFCFTALFRRFDLRYAKSYLARKIKLW